MWPQIFKHHISVVEGHTRMLEMVQKHTVQGTGNYETITNLVKRGHEMLRQAKDISRTFVYLARTFSPSTQLTLAYSDPSKESA